MDIQEKKMDIQEKTEVAKANLTDMAKEIFDSPSSFAEIFSLLAFPDSAGKAYEILSSVSEKDHNLIVGALSTIYSNIAEIHGLDTAGKCTCCCAELPVN